MLSSEPRRTVRFKILIAAPFPPQRDGFHGGSQVIGRLVEDLSVSSDVGVVYLRGRGESPMEEALAANCRLVEEVPRHTSEGSARKYMRMLSALAKGRPMWVEDWNVPAYRDRLQAVVDRWKPDIVQFEFHTMAQYAGCVGSTPAVVVEHEPGAAAARDRCDFSSGWRRPILAQDTRAWENYERWLLKRFKAIVCFTPRDRRALLELAPEARIEVIPPRAPSIRPSIASAGVTENTILFVGNFGHPPNIDAALRMVKSIFPKVRTLHPLAKLQLVGDAPSRELLDYRGGDVDVTGRVADVEPFVGAAAVVIAPLRIGGGIRIKVMEALAHGKAVVASPLAAEGLGVQSGREILLAEDDDTFAQTIASLLADPGQRSRLERHALQWSHEFGRHDRAGSAFQGLYRSLIAHHGSAAP